MRSSTTSLSLRPVFRLLHPRSMTARQLKASRARLESYLGEMLAPLGRKDRRHWGQVYGRGLLLDGERKSVGAMVPRLPEGEEQALQQFVSQSPWPWEPNCCRACSSPS